MNTKYYRLSDILTNPSTATPLGTISGGHHHFSFNGQYCITFGGDRYRVYQWNHSSGWVSYGEILIPSGQDPRYTSCYINDTGQYAVMYRDYYDTSINQLRYVADVYHRGTSGWTYKWTLPNNRAISLIQPGTGGAWRYNDYEPFVFIPGTSYFCLNYDIGSGAYRFVTFNAAAASPPSYVQIGDNSVSEAYGFIKSGSNVYVYRLRPDSSNGYRMGVYNVGDPTAPALSAEFGRETNRSGALPKPFVGNEGFGLFSNSVYGVIFNYP